MSKRFPAAEILQLTAGQRDDHVPGCSYLLSGKTDLDTAKP